MADEETRPALRIENLSLDASSPKGLVSLVRNVSIEVGSGEVVGLVGESGSGKSQTALAISGLSPQNVRRTSGRIWCDGEELSALSESELHRRRGAKLAYVFQDPMSALNPTMRVGRQMTDVLRRARPQLDKGQLVRAAHEILAAVGLTDGAWIMRAYPFQLSGGMRQRVMIALAYGCRPALIIADEPTTALDVTLQAQVLDLILALNGQVKSAMLFISHDLAIVRRICTRLYVMRKGEVVESGACAQIIASPQHEYTKTLLASARAKEASP